MRKTTFRVTQENIDAGVQRMRGHCALALAIKEQDSDLVRPSVDRETIRVSDEYDDLIYEWDTPMSLRAWIDSWDENKANVEPITFVLDPKYARRIRPRKHVPAAARAQYAQRARERVQQGQPIVPKPHRQAIKNGE